MAFLEKNMPTSPSSLVKELYKVYDEVIAGCLRNGTKLPCKKGCSWCCFLRVKVTPLEVLCIADYLKASLKPGGLSALQQRLVGTDEITRGMDGNRRISVKKVCPLIVGNKCLVYPVRPITCRIYHSLDASDCESSLDNGKRSLRIRLDISIVGMGILAGMMEGLRQVGLHPRLLELIAGLRIAMDEPESMRNWLAGAPAFSEAEIDGVKG
jgi:Fe-S-cluster containining protein